MISKNETSMAFRMYFVKSQYFSIKFDYRNEVSIYFWREWGLSYDESSVKYRKIWHMDNNSIDINKNYVNKKFCYMKGKVHAKHESIQKYNVQSQ